MPSAVNQHAPHAIHLSADQLAARWQTTRGHLANQRSYGRGVPYLKLGSRVMYRLSDVLAYEAACVVQTSTLAHGE